MLTTSQVPKTKQELIQSLQKANFKSFQVYENLDLLNFPNKSELSWSRFFGQVGSEVKVYSGC